MSGAPELGVNRRMGWTVFGFFMLILGIVTLRDDANDAANLLAALPQWVSGAAAIIGSIILALVLIDWIRAKRRRAATISNEKPQHEHSERPVVLTTQLRRAREAKIAEWRSAAIEYKNLTAITKKLNLKSEVFGVGASNLRSRAWYCEIRGLLTDEVIHHIEGAGIRVAALRVDGKSIPTPTDAEILLEEIARIEREWGLI